MNPILKWAGGKRQLLTHILPLIPNDYHRYYEPFLGAGAVLFELQPTRAIINDANTELINVYKIVKEQPEELILILEEHNRLHNRNYYYQIRNIDRIPDEYNRLSDVEKAARTVYLNRTCYNGLYRVNRLGWFNTPIGHNTTIQIVNADGIREISEYLNNNAIRVLNEDYTNALRWIRRTDFVFIDPPYYPIDRDSFLRYDINLFGIERQEELKRYCDRLTERGVRFIQTNSCCDRIRELYNNYRIIEVDVHRFINARADGRRNREVIILNY